MRCTTEGVRLIQEFEGCVLSAYQDQGGIWTIAWGRTQGVGPGDVCTQEEADRWLLCEDIPEAEQQVLRCVPAPALNDHQLSALVSFVYNVGLGEVGVKSGFEWLKAGGHSTLLTALREGDWGRAALQFPLWDHIGVQRSAGLSRRRLAEQALFMKPIG